MTTLTITLPDISSQKIQERAKTEGFKNPEEWCRFWIERRINSDIIKKFAVLRAITKPVDISASEAKAIQRGRAAIKRGDYVTLDQLGYELGSQRRKTSTKKAGTPSF